MVTFKSKYLADAAVNWWGGTTYPAAIPNIWVALITTAPTDRTGASMVECTGGSYARQAIANGNLGSVATVGSGTSATEQRSNGTQVSFTGMPACTVVGAAAFDSNPQSTPSAPTATGNTGTGSSFTSAQTANVAVSYVTWGGETLASSNTLVTIAATGDNIVVTLPAFPSGVIGMNVYVSTASGGATLNKVNAGTSPTSTTSSGSVTVTAFPATGTAVPGGNTSSGNFLGYSDLTGGSQAVSSGATFNLPVSNFFISE